MDAQTLATGGSLLIFVVAAAVTAPLSFFLLWLYRRAVLRGQNVATGVTDVDAAPASQPLPIRPLRLTPVSALRAGAEEDRSGLGHAVKRSLRRQTLAYSAAGLAFTVPFTGAWMIHAAGGFHPVAVLVLTVCFAWPLVVALSLLASGWIERAGHVALYLAVALIAGAWRWSIGRDATPLNQIELWLIMNGPTTVLLAAFLTRRIRAVGPLVLAFTVAGAAGAIVLPLLVGSSDRLASVLLSILAAGGLNGREVFVCLSLAGFGILGGAGWALLRLIGRSYRLKRMSDQSLTLDAVWLVFAANNAILLASGGVAWILTGVVAFALYKGVLWAALARLMRPAAAGSRGPTLLLLRVFALGSRSLRLFDALARHWLRVGPIVLVAGPDLATGLVEPPEFLEFAGGRMSRGFVQDRDDLERRLAELDTRPDPDGRHRVSEFFCRSDTWRMTMRQLAARSDAVLMDLRSFSPANQGCLYELGQLLSNVPLPQVLLIADATTDVAFLEASLQDLWRSVPADSPNRSLQDSEVRLHQVNSASGGEVRTLLSLLYVAGGLDHAGARDDLRQMGCLSLGRGRTL